MLKRILDHINTAILLFNEDLNLAYVNMAGEILLADSARHLIGVNAADLFKTSDPAFLLNLRQCLNLNEPLVDRELSLDRMGQSFIVNFTATPFSNEQGRDEILVELQRVDNHLRISKEEQLLSQQNTARLLVRGLAHEIKNPLGGLRGAAQLLNLELTDPDLKEYTQIIIAESDRLQGIMDKLLGPNKPPEFKVINVHEVLERVRHLMEAEAPVSVKVICDYDPSIPDIKADRDLLIQAVLNITKNAVQAINNKGTVTLKTRIQRNQTIGRQHHKLTVKVDIIDDGPGIDPDIIERIFYPMITGRADGTGLGLSIAQSLINQHNGLIECHSEPGNTVFSIILPI